ncbi:MAG: DinB family protein [Chloroflexi bacterium]|nr:DinB family protein [Chloroflexota bacterium]MCL5274097.1 DinB family protein [Chloroflexota bacterium]
MAALTQSQEQTLARFASGSDRLRAALRDVPDSAFDLSLEPGEWSIRQIVHHLSDDGVTWCMALRKALATPGVPIRFEGFPGNEAWANALGYDRLPIQPALALIAAHGEVIAQLMRHFPDKWDGYVTAIDPAGGAEQKVTAGDMIGFLGEHFDEHIKVIEAIMQRHKVQHLQVNEQIRKLGGANVDIDLATPPEQIAWLQAKCPWNEAERTDQHRCAVKNVSICQYFRGVEPLDTLLCGYPPSL